MCVKPSNRTSFWCTPSGTISGIFYTDQDIFHRLSQTLGYAVFLKCLYPHLPEGWYDAVASQLQARIPFLSYHDSVLKTWFACRLWASLLASPTSSAWHAAKPRPFLLYHLVA